MGLTLLSEGLTDFWLCESLDSLLPISRWITISHFWHLLIIFAGCLFVSLCMLIVKNFHTSTNYSALLPSENKDNTDLQNNRLSFSEGNPTLPEKKIDSELKQH